MHRLRQWAESMSLWGETAGVVGIMVMVVVNCSDVLGAKLFLQPVPGSTEIVSLAQVATIAFAVAATQRLRGHISVEMFVLRMSSRLRAAIKAFTSALCLLLFCLIIWESMLLGHSYYRAGEVTATVLIPLYLFAYAFGLAMVPMALMMFCDVVDALKETFSEWTP
jgi:TRAP-type C4-dicarboxylate transport system permease small subunit